MYSRQNKLTVISFHWEAFFTGEWRIYWKKWGQFSHHWHISLWIIFSVLKKNLSPCRTSVLIPHKGLFSRVHATLSICRSVDRSHFTFFMIFIFGPYCSCPNGLVISNMAPAHPHATSVAVYPALFIKTLRLKLLKTENTTTTQPHVKPTTTFF